MEFLDRELREMDLLPQVYRERREDGANTHSPGTWCRQQR
jgi:hypothetical protein